MTFRKMRTRWLAATLVMFAGLLGACAEEREPIDRVQPNALEKSMFTGEYYYQRTVVDVPSGNGFTFVGGTDFSGLKRITWDIQENMLLARRSYELIAGADDLAITGEDYEGEVIAAFRITSHFDITRAYNSTTGEPLNIVFENTTDRPWYERAHFRVDWSQNLVTNYDLDFEAASIESIPYYVQEFNDATGARNDDAPHFEDDGSYFDITSRIFARAAMMEIPEYGTVPLCWLRGEEFSECGAGEYSIRHSFQRVDETRQYEPLVYKGVETELFGFFWTDRMNYDPQLGIVEQQRERYLNRHNLWERWFNDDGSQIPYAERTLRPIVYFVNRDYPEDLKDIARLVGDQWNAIFSEAVREVGYPLGAEERAFIVCANNPVIEGDDPRCGPVGNSPRIGDIRYSFMAYIPKFMEYGLLGLGPSNTDPLTGEIMSGMAYVYHHNNLAAYRTAEMVELLNGTRSGDDFIDGVDISEWANEVNNDEQLVGRIFGLEEARHMVDSLANGWAAAYWAAERRPPTAADEAFQHEHGFEAWADPHLDTMYERGILNGERQGADARLALLRDTEIEDMLLNPEILLAAGIHPNMPLNDATLLEASVVRGGFGRRAMIRQQYLEEFAHERNLHLPEMADDALMGLARELRGRSTEEAYGVIRESIYTAVLAHEVGHSVGLMHNFGGSDDAINYFPEYWNIRDDGEVGPRLEDPITDAEINANIYNYAYSSIMDYAGRYTIDGAGPGRYDRAAILFGYAQKIEVFRDRSGVSNTTLNSWFTGDGDVTEFTVIGPRVRHYTSFWDAMGTNLTDPANRLLIDVDAFEGRYDQVSLNGQTYSRVPYIYCSHSRSDISDSCLTRDAGADSMERMTNILDDLNTWYILRNFPRGRIGIDNYDYVSRYYGRVYGRLKHWHDLYGLIVPLLAQFYPPETMADFLSDPAEGYGNQTWAVQNAFNYLMQTITMPDIGDYAGPIPQADGTQLLRSGFTPTRISLDVSDARFYSTDWSTGGRECGYQWYECLHHVGFYLDKIMAIEALSDSNTNFVARSSPLDLREWEVGYYNTFPDQIAALNEALMSGDWSQVGPYVQGNELRFPNYAGPLTAVHAEPVDPAATFSVQLYWQVLGQARFPQNFDRTFVDDSRVFVVGTGMAPELETDRLASVLDPVSGQTFGALRVDGRRGAGEAMIDRALALKRWSDFCDDDSATVTEDDDCEVIPADFARFVTPESVALEYRSHIQLLRVVADLTETMTYGDPYNP